MAETQHIVRLESIQVAGSQLSMRFSFDQHQFSTTYWYDFDLKSLDAAYGSRFMEMVYFHCAAFAINELCSLAPDVLDWGDYAHWHTAEFEKLWRIVLNKVWAQWRYENNLPDWAGPRFASKPVSSTSIPAPVDIQRGGDTEVNTLAYFGGGKDSLVTSNLLQKANIPFACLTYSHSVYGRGAVQHAMSDAVLKHCSPTARHQLWLLDDFLESPVLESLGKCLGIKTLCAAEGPASLFATIPILLHYHYTTIAIGNEHSANIGNLVWERTGEEVNHQWGKSLESEIVLDRYLREVMVRNIRYFSVLQPIHDVVIFSLAGNFPDAIALTNSCNVVKPWCRRCPKCCYVLLCFKAYLPNHLIDSLFQGENLFDVAENQVHFREMLGLGKKKPFECIGEIDEARLAFELCRRKGVQGRAMEMYKREVASSMGEADLLQLVDRYTTVYCEASHIPLEYQDRLFPILKQAGTEARKQLKAALIQDA